MKSFSPVLLNLSREVKYESGSCLKYVYLRGASCFSPTGISLTITVKPNDIAFFAFLMTAWMPIPCLSRILVASRLGGSASGMKHNLVVQFFSCLSWLSVQAEPRHATVFLTPIRCKRRTSGAPSTKYITSARMAGPAATSIPKTVVSLSKSGVVVLLRYLGTSSFVERVLPVKATYLPERLRIGIMIRLRKVSTRLPFLLYLAMPSSKSSSAEIPLV